MKILFICRGNVGRSQMAASLFGKLAPGHEVISAGTHVVDKEGNSRDGQKLKDLPAAEYVITCMVEEGVDVRENLRRQLTPEMVAGADKIIVMAEPETIPDYLKDSPNAEYWNVVDPKGQSLEIHKEIKEEIRGKLSELMKSL